jgi:hypothetical protein
MVDSGANKAYLTGDDLDVNRRRRWCVPISTSHSRLEFD